MTLFVYGTTTVGSRTRTLDQQAEHQGVGDAGGPLVDRVDRRRATIMASAGGSRSSSPGFL
jgi:hypothetical protein